MKIHLITTVLVTLLLVVSCKQVDFTAPEGSTIKLVAQPSMLDKHEISTLTVTGTRASGAPLPDDTIVRFTASGVAGDLTPNPVQLKHGIAVSHFVAGDQTGDVSITAFSGDATDHVTVSIEKRTAKTIILTANPSTLPFGGGSSKLQAFVFDEDGNPVAGVKVFFQTDNGTLKSGGNPVTTDNSGVARDVLTTTVTAEVTAQTNTGLSVTTTVNVGEGLTCSFTIAPSTSVEIGDEVVFTDTSTDSDGTITTNSWDFGDDSSAEGQSVTHSYSAAGDFLVIHSISDDVGNSITCQPQTITVTEPAS
jgi:PKD domain/Bacterial Ig-like domain (group 1)